jgi:excinuclease ABC subunit C
MVTFINGEADKNYYRHFRIRKAKGGDDYNSMREVALRRGKHFPDWGKPDLIIVDGGKGQVSSFAMDIPVVGIAKHPDRLIVGENKIKLSGLALNLVSRIRDEAHRFARRYHHHLISNIYRNAGTT